MPCQSPKVTVSVWEKGENVPVAGVESVSEDNESGDEDGGPSSNQQLSSLPARRDSTGEWQRDSADGTTGLGPKDRPSDNVSSINEMATQRETEDRNQEVGQWLDQRPDAMPAPIQTSAEEIQALKRDDKDDLPLGGDTENRYKADRTYINPKGGEMSETDFEIISGPKWADPPTLHPIRQATPGRNLPASSQAAIERFEAKYKEFDTASRTATWGTRRRSLGSIDLDMEVTNGNLFKSYLSPEAGTRTTSQVGF